MTHAAWYRDRASLELITRGYLPWLAVFNLAWESAQLPLYTLWTEATPAEIAFAVAHCTAGDVLIGLAALAIALLAGRESAPAQWRWRRIFLLVALAGASYTVFSEWLNVSLERWSYSSLMPTVSMAGLRIGLSPLAQWLVVPAVSLYLARRA